MGPGGDGPRLSLNMACIKGVTLERQLTAAAAASWAGVGLWMDDIDQARRSGVSLDTVAAQVRGAGLAVEELCSIGKWQDCVDADFPAVLAEADRLARACKTLGCRVLVAVPSPRRTPAGEAARRFHEVCSVAAAQDVGVALEFFGTAEEVRDIEAARRLVDAAAAHNGGLLLDTFHFLLGGSRPSDLDSLGAEQVLLVHVSDAMDVPREKLETFHDYRTFPGEGTIDYSPILQWIERTGYRGPVSLEIWNRDLLRADAAHTARRGRESLRALFAARAGGGRRD